MGFEEAFGIEPEKPDSNPTIVVNMRRDSYDVYIGRAGHGMDGYFGNRSSKPTETSRSRF